MLEPSNLYVEKACLSLVREYLIRRDFKRTLETLNQESAPLNPKIGFYSSRRHLGQDMGMEGLMRVNKEARRPLKSMLEVLVKCFLQDRELLLRSTFANSCYYMSQKQKSKPPRREKKPKMYDNGVIGPLTASSTPPPSFNSHRHVDMPIVASNYEDNPNRPTSPHPVVHKPQNVIDVSKHRTSRHGKLDASGGGGDHKKKEEVETPKISKRISEKIPIRAQEDPMATFCRKLQEAKIMSNHSRTSLSLEADHEESGGGDNYEAGDSWIPEESKTRSKLEHSLSLSVVDKRSTPPSSFKVTDRTSSEVKAHPTEVKGHVLLGQNLLESKQNLLAQVSLSPEENEIRQQAQDLETSVSSFISNVSTSPNKSKGSKSGQSEKSSAQSTSSSAKSTTTVTTDQGFKIRDVDSLQTPSESSKKTKNSGSATNSSAASSSSKGGTSKSQEASNKFFQKSSVTSNLVSTRSSVIKVLDQGTWQQLKSTVLGERGILYEGWVGQGFAFNYNIPYALIQKKGGPCGVLAAVQALLLRNLMFGSAFCDPNELPVEGFEISATSSDRAQLSRKRSLALIGTLTEILWRCRSNEGGSGASSTERRGVTVGLTNGGSFGPGFELRLFDTLDELKTFVEANLYRFDCIGLVYSAVLTRGIERVQADMDFPNSSLLGQHGYCTQELTNLLLVGRAISNAFDNDIVLDGKVLKGISAPSDIGLLSLFEHYNSCTVGSYLKNPRFPLWIVCSESHFSLLFSNDMELTSKSTEALKEIKSFDLFYYDGLAHQEKIITLTIENGNKNNNLENRGGLDQDDLIPPLEKCIRTKWEGVTVDWNDAEPIL